MHANNGSERRRTDVEHIKLIQWHCWSMGKWHRKGSHEDGKEKR